ncbi:hypothetical protein LIER_12687 [Lithospermum erythrorhizon]|uniref:Uncharacterized protein n=1 Tax=Lithospermum erythrorhizon TaxID=34254 RepID=A0AAV3PU96_LITER
MGSNYFGDLNLGNQRSSLTNNSSRKGKKSSPDKPNKQPQRGLGVAQLEKIRLHTQMGSSTYLPPSNHHHLPFPSTIQEDIRTQTAYSSSPSFSNSSSFGFPVQQQSFMMGLSEMGNIRYPDYVQRSMPTSRWNHGNDIPLSQPSITGHFLNQQEEDFLEKRRKKDKIGSMVLRSQDPESNGNQELDLELKLSL